ncbi:MAG TPA: NAD(P)H-dependent glycerol-3-phosphate dehydrogenase [Saprospiraceae bacterium]|nr:NAD(P)H-dependent glycerol-3-phosphate dehydrogenase [Saprospiraceae bacterium]
MTDQQIYGVIGAGSFGTAVANLLAHNVKVLMYSREPAVVQRINKERKHLGIKISERISATDSLQEVASTCQTIFPIVPSVKFREMMQQLGPYLNPAHILIHGTKGFDTFEDGAHVPETDSLLPDQVHTMSQVILQESSVRRIGCLSGPNLASEIMEGQPTATLVASPFSEVITIGKSVLNSPNFKVYGSDDLLGAELAGALKNIVALGSGILRGKGLGKNIQAMLITHGLLEMVRFGRAFGAEVHSFFGTAGIGDLVATATSKSSRNFTFGYRLGQGESVTEIKKSMPELAEGVRTIQITNALARHARLRVPITNTLYNVIFDHYEIDKAIKYLLAYPYDVDVSL